MSKNFRKEGQPEKERIAKITGMDIDKVYFHIKHILYNCLISISGSGVVQESSKEGSTPSRKSYGEEPSQVSPQPQIYNFWK